MSITARIILQHGQRGQRGEAAYPSKKASHGNQTAALHGDSERKLPRIPAEPEPRK